MVCMYLLHLSSLHRHTMPTGPPFSPQKLHLSAPTSRHHTQTQLDNNTLLHIKRSYTQPIPHPTIKERNSSPSSSLATYVSIVTAEFLTR